MTRLLLNQDFVVESLGGIEEVMKIGSQFGIDIFDLLSEGLFWYSIGRNKDLSFAYQNYKARDRDEEVPGQFIPYPDLHIKLRDYNNSLRGDSVISESRLSDIGYRQTRDQAKESIKNWFHAEVTPILLEYVFI
jgi:hypothetical protein